MSFNEITKGKCIPLGILTLIIFYLIGGTSTSILPFIFLTCIAAGYIKDMSVVDALITGLIIAAVGSIINLIIGVGIIYMTYGSAYAVYTLKSVGSLNFIFSIIVGIIGGVVGYYVKKEVVYNQNLQR